MLEIAVAPGNPKKITGLQDLAKEGVTTVICAPAVPCGAATQKVLATAGVDLKPASEEQNVTAVLTKVESGDADAGLVYVTDVKSASGKVDGVTFPESSTAVNTYPIAQITASKNAAVAQAFIALVVGPQGQQVLADRGLRQAVTRSAGSPGRSRPAGARSRGHLTAAVRRHVAILQ